LRGSIAYYILISYKDYVKDFYKSIAVPLLWDLKVAYGNAKDTIVSNRKLFRGEEIVILGKLENPCTGPEPKIIAQNNGANLDDFTILDEVYCTESIEIIPPPEGDKMANPNGRPIQMDLKKILNYLKIRKWQREHKGVENKEESDMLKKKITECAIENGFVTKAILYNVNLFIRNSRKVRIAKKYNICAEIQGGEKSHSNDTVYIGFF